MEGLGVRDTKGLWGGRGHSRGPAGSPGALFPPSSRPLPHCQELMSRANDGTRAKGGEPSPPSHPPEQPLPGWGLWGLQPLGSLWLGRDMGPLLGICWSP